MDRDKVLHRDAGALLDPEIFTVAEIPRGSVTDHFFVGWLFDYRARPKFSWHLK